MCLPTARWSHLQRRRLASRHTVDMDASPRLPRGSHPDARLRGDARGCDGGIREELATGIALPCHWRGRYGAQARFFRAGGV
jgi:hypothetical protein